MYVLDTKFSAPVFAIRPRSLMKQPNMLRKSPLGFRRHVKSIYEPMAEAAKPGFSDDSLKCLYAIIYQSADFHHYLQTVDTESPDLLDTEYVSHSVFATVEPFTCVFENYRILVGSLDSRINWNVTSLCKLKNQFNSMYQNFLLEQKFEEKCRILIDIFKYQIVFVGMQYG